MAEGWSIEQKDVLHSRALLLDRGLTPNFPIANLYKIISMDATADLVTGIWVEVVATVGVGAVMVGVEGIA